jgi:hypothetical protein
MNNNDITLKIGRINFKTETFCTKWNDKMYCVDVFEDAEERSAWLYEANSGIKTLMWGEKIGQQSRDEFLDCVFSNLPDYIDMYEDDMEIYEEAMCDAMDDKAKTYRHYRVLPEYRDLWSNDSDWDGIVDAKEIDRLANEWGMMVEELMKQVEEVD